MLLAGQGTDAARLLQVAASVSSLALQLPSFNDGAGGGVASTSTGTGNWLSQQERSDLDALGKSLHRFLMRRESRQSRGATSFSGARTSARRLQTQAEVAHSHAAARGVEAGDPGPVDLLRHHVARQPGEQLTNPEDDVFVAHAAVDAGQCLSAFVTRLGSALAQADTGTTTGVAATSGVSASGDVDKSMEASDAEPGAVMQPRAETVPAVPVAPLRVDGARVRRGATAESESLPGLRVDSEVEPARAPALARGVRRRSCAGSADTTMAQPEAA